jgi:hypothetical protein
VAAVPSGLSLTPLKIKKFALRSALAERREKTHTNQQLKYELKYVREKGNKNDVKEINIKAGRIK